MKYYLRELADCYPNRAACALDMGITESNLNMLISRDREVEQLKDGRWVLITDKTKIFNLTRC